MIRAILFALGTTAIATGQELTLLLPAGGTRGTEVAVRCYGRDLKDTVSAVFQREGIEVLSLQAERDNLVEMRLRIPANCPFGAHPFALHTRRGLTRTEAFHVGPLPTVAEAAEHGTRDQAQRIDLDVTVDGRMLAEQIDWYTFAAEAGQTINLDVEGIRLGIYALDLQFEVFDRDGKLLLRCDDSPLGRSDPVGSFVPPATGDYWLALRDVAWRGSSLGAYRLHVGTFPRPTGVLPAGGRPGETITARPIGDLAHAAHTATATLPDHHGLVQVFPILGGRTAPTAVHAHCSDHTRFCEPDGVPDGTPAPFAFHGVVAEAGEEDRVPFVANKGKRLQLSVQAQYLGSALDPVLIVRDADGKALASNDDGVGLDGQLQFNPPADGTFTACVRDHLRRGGEGFFYNLVVGQLPGAAHASEAVPGRRSEDFGLVVPQGGRNATLLQITGMPRPESVTIDYTSLPAGVAATPMRLRKNTRFVPLVVRANADAELLATLARPTATADDGKQIPPLEHYHRYPTLRVRNNIVYSGAIAMALPVAVAAPMPITLSAQSPKVPLVRSGSLELQVHVDRRKYEGTVSVRALALPPGVSASTVRLGGKQTDGTMRFNANSRTPLGSWPLVLIASIREGRVTRETSTEVLELVTEEPWLTGSLTRTSVEQGATGEFTVSLDKKRDFDGEVEVVLGRVPKGVRYEVPPVPKDGGKLPIKLRADKEARRGRHRSIYMRVEITTDNGKVTHTVGGGEIRVDRPRPAAGGRP